MSTSDNLGMLQQGLTYLHLPCPMCTKFPRPCGVTDIPYMAPFPQIPSHFLPELEYLTFVPGEMECWYRSQVLCHLQKRASIRKIVFIHLNTLCYSGIQIHSPFFRIAEKIEQDKRNGWSCTELSSIPKSNGVDLVTIVLLHLPREFTSDPL